MDCEFLRATSCLCRPNGVGGWWQGGVPAAVSFLANPKSDVVRVFAFEAAAAEAAADPEATALSGFGILGSLLFLVVSRSGFWL